MRHRTLIATSVIAVAVVLLLVGCGGSSSGPSVAHLGRAASPAAGSGSIGSGSVSPGSPDFMAQLLKYAGCVREHGVPNFPDPSANDGFAVHIDPSSPAFVAAQATCHKLMPGGGPPARGSATHPSAQALASMLKTSQCMRRHGISDFPDPGSRMPSNPPTRGVITIMGGVVLVFPSASAMRSPAFAQAETACNLGIRPPA
jgi:hypothetical protein